MEKSFSNVEESFSDIEESEGTARMLERPQSEFPLLIITLLVGLHPGAAEYKWWHSGAALQFEENHLLALKLLLSLIVNNMEESEGTARKLERPQSEIAVLIITLLVGLHPGAVEYKRWHSGAALQFEENHLHAPKLLLSLIVNSMEESERFCMSFGFPSLSNMEESEGFIYNSRGLGMGARRAT